MNSKSLPEEIVLDILTRLPVKSILRFKSVSKNWYTLLTDPHFTAAHLRRHSSPSTNSLLIVRHGSAHGELATSVFDVNLATLHRNLPVPENRLDDRSASIIGSCNGLLCIEFSPDNILFWNPATKLSRQLPSFNLRSQFTHLTTRFVSIGERNGFGFNPETEDYKLVKFAMFYYKDWRTEDQTIWDDVLEVKAIVFSWKTWSWKVLKHAHIPAATYDNQVAANGHVYWVGSRDGMADFVLAFDLVTDSFRKIEWPTADDQKLKNRLDMETRVSVFKSCLVGLREDDDDDFEVLVMSENGGNVDGSDWDKLWRFGCFDGSSVDYDYDGCWNGVQVVMRRGCYRSFLYLFCPLGNDVRLLDDISVRFYEVVDYV
ncbi:F-box/kelch-repeat protein At3g06240, partial [Linum grandiflorum]